MAKVFVSYSRKDIEFAKRLTGELQKGELDFWIDWEGIPPTVDWWKEIEKGIEEADVFLFIMSPDSVKSKICGQETDHAAKNGKRLIPVVARDIKTEDAPPQLRPLNWIFLRENDDFDAAVKKLQTAIQTDYEWVQTQRRLQVKALEWERINHESSFLLRGKDLQDAELQLATNSSKEPNPTDLQRDYVFKSRQAVDRQRRTITGISIAGIIALAALAVFGFVQAGLATSNATESKNNAATAQANLVVANTAQANAESAKAAAQASEAEALTQKQIAEKSANEVLAGNLAAQADALKNNDHALALLLGMEAYQRKPDILSRATLFQLLQFTPYTRLFGFHGQVSSVAASPDGKWIAIASSNELSILDANTRQIIFSTSDGLGLVNSLAFNNDGALLAAGGCVPESCDSRGQISMWDMRDPQRPLLASDVPNSHTAPVTTLAFSPDGKILATGSDDRTITLWDSETLNQNGKPLNSTGQITSLAFSPDGKTLVSAGSDRSINIWDVSVPATVKLVGTAPAQHTGVISSIAFGPLESGKFASASEDNTVALWDWDSNSRALSGPKKLEGHAGFVQSVAFNETGTVLASTGFDRTVILWNAKTGERIGSALSVHTKAINAVVFGRAETQNILFSGSSDNTVVLWDLATQQPVSQPVTEESSPEGLGQTAKSGEVEAKADGSQISLTGRPDPLTGHTGQVNTLNFSPQKVDARLLLVSASADQTVIVWDVSNVSEAGVFLKLAGFDSPVSSAFFSTDGKQLTTIEDNGHTTRWSIDPSDWAALACKAVQDNLTIDKWAAFVQYLSGQLPAETCVTQP